MKSTSITTRPLTVPRRAVRSSAAPVVATRPATRTIADSTVDTDSVVDEPITAEVVPVPPIQRAPLSDELNSLVIDVSPAAESLEADTSSQAGQKPFNVSAPGFEIPATQAVMAPTWVGQRAGVSIELILRLAFFLVAPAMYVVLCIVLNHFELLIVLGAVVVIYGIFRNARSRIERLAALRKFPGIGTAVEIVTRIDNFYWEHKPRSFLFYLFYPITGIGALFWRSVRREVRLYRKILGGFVVLIAVKEIWSYQETYPPYLHVEDALGYILGYSLTLVLATIVLLIPTITTAVTLHHTGRNRELNVMTLLALGVAVPIGLIGLYSEFVVAETVSTPAWLLISERLEKPEFRRDLHLSTEMFLRHHIEHLDHWNSADTVLLHPELTSRFRTHIAGLAVKDESKAFYVFTVPGHEERAWLAVGYGLDLPDARAHFLFLMSPDGRLRGRWQGEPMASPKDRVANFPRDVSHTSRMRGRLVRGFENVGLCDGRLISRTATAHRDSASAPRR